MDPPSVPQPAVPVSLANTAFKTVLLSKDPTIKHTSLLIFVAFYFLLRVGEYTKPQTVMKDGKRVPATQTKQLIFYDVVFFCMGQMIPRRSPLKTLLTADIAVLKLTTQKYGKMGQTITQHATGNAVCPVLSLAPIVHHTLSNGGTNDTLLCSYVARDKWHTVTAEGVVKQVRSTAKVMKLLTTGINPLLIGAHSLRAGDAMALKLHGYADTTIMKMER